MVRFVAHNEVFIESRNPLHAFHLVFNGEVLSRIINVLKVETDYACLTPYLMARAELRGTEDSISPTKNHNRKYIDPAPSFDCTTKRCLRTNVNIYTQLVLHQRRFIFVNTHWTSTIHVLLADLSTKNLLGIDVTCMADAQMH